MLQFNDVPAIWFLRFMSLYTHSLHTKYCDMTPESRDSSLLANGGKTCFRGNVLVHARSNRRITVSMQLRGKHTSITMEELLGGDFCAVRTEML
jgi:hypothetical protein